MVVVANRPTTTTVGIAARNLKMMSKTQIVEMSEEEKNKKIPYGTEAKVEYSMPGKKGDFWVKVCRQHFDADPWGEEEAYVVKPLDKAHVEECLPGITEIFENVNGGVWLASRSQMKEFRFKRSYVIDYD